MNRSTIQSVVNGRPIERVVPNRQTLAEFLRLDLGLTGTKTSCELQVCGVCAVLVDGAPISACTYLAIDIDGRDVVTVEGLGDSDRLHPIQQAFIESFAMQCGFCTPGFLVMTAALLEQNHSPDEEDIKEFFEGNICRCTGYRPIIEAVLTAAERMTEGAQ